jgi:hypothetical protein
MAVGAALVAALSIAAGAAPGARVQPPQVAPADATPFVGEWTLQLEGPNGPATFALNVKVEKDKVLGEITAPGSDPNPITDVTKSDKSLLLSYTFDYQGNDVFTVVSLTPGPEDKTSAQIDFANGAYVMTGTATKKEPAK